MHSCATGISCHNTDCTDPFAADTIRTSVIGFRTSGKSTNPVCGQRQGAEKRDQVDFYLTRGRGNIYPTDAYIIEHIMLANTPP